MTKRPKPSRSHGAAAPTNNSAVHTAQREADSDADVASEFARTYLPESIAVLVLCLTPVAIPAVYFGLATRQASQDADLAAAKSASEMARIWFIFSICFGVVANIAILGVYLISQKT